MDIKTTAAAGTQESSDINIIIEPGDSNGISIDLTSPVEKQFGKQIRKVITETLMELGIDKANVSATDKGALDCVIKARVQAAAYRAAKSKKYKW
jgi:citrate lyase subunit gamma (acyl carrier protein)